MIPKSRSRSTFCSSSLSEASHEGLSTKEANSTARHAANGRRAHHRCSVEGCPQRIDFSLAAAELMASSGRATSISFVAPVTCWLRYAFVMPSG